MAPHSCQATEPSKLADQTSKSQALSLEALKTLVGRALKDCVLGRRGPAQISGLLRFKTNFKGSIKDEMGEMVSPSWHSVRISKIT